MAIRRHLLVNSALSWSDGVGRAVLAHVNQNRNDVDVARLEADYSLSAAVLEDLLARRRAGAGDAELINLVRQPDRGGLHAERARSLMAELPTA
jgi:hypothetical protein